MKIFRQVTLFSEYKGETLLIEGESANKKSSADLGAKSDSTTPTYTPQMRITKK